MTSEPAGARPDTDVRTPEPGPEHERSARLRRRLAWWAVIACAPYLMLKLLWVVGVDVGVVDGADINRTKWVVGNLLTFLMDGTAALIAHTLTKPRVGRGRAWPVVLPMWVATGLLGVIMLAVPLTCVAALVTDGHNPFVTDDLLYGWVYAVVYAGFIVEGTVLVGAFVLYANERWGGFLRARVRDLPPLGGRVPVRAAALTAALLMTVSATLHLIWAAGSSLGMTDQWIAERDADGYWLDCTEGVLAAAGAVGLVVLALRIGRGRVRTPLALAWLGTGGVFGWGGWMALIVSTSSSESPIVQRTSTLLGVVYTAEMIIGLLALTAGWYALSRYTALYAAREQRDAAAAPGTGGLPDGSSPLPSSAGIPAA
ncbi:hypothetical protein [Yinghuangia seranimata]|uniref:hypothetical protein n=1 Tax=Yinghuangia seranimata TaxID=408067 RepID=UPI00248CE34D|nr:hypothetical protein [Yinghuangia seranimata]MDI2130651.1 hypothetical protein [Yinghuangia seranimata]